MTFRVNDVVVIEAEDDSRCELCGKISETRPYGPNGERICWECGNKSPEARKARDKKFAELLNGKVQ